MRGLGGWCGRGARLRAVGFLTTLAAVGCGTVDRIGAGEDGNGAADPGIGLGASEYRRVYERWTRHATLYRRFVLTLEVWATYKDHEFRRAFARRYAAVYRLDAAALQRLLAHERRIAAAMHEVHVVLQAHEADWQDLSEEESAWRVALIDRGGRELQPAEIVRLDRPDPYQAEFFPRQTPWTVNYLLRFPRAPGDVPGGSPARAPLRLVFFGPLGRAQLEWEAAEGRS